MFDQSVIKTRIAMSYQLNQQHVVMLNAYLFDDREDKKSVFITVTKVLRESGMMRPAAGRSGRLARSIMSTSDFLKDTGVGSHSIA